jgi:hypothetical protein
MRLGRAITDLVNEVGNFSQILDMPVRKAAIPQLEFKIGSYRNQVGVATTLADAVHCALHVFSPGGNGSKRIRHSTLKVVVAMNSNLGLAGYRSNNVSNRFGNLIRKRRTVRIAECDYFGSATHRSGNAFERVVAVIAPPIKEVFGVIDNPLPATDEELN